MTRSIAEAPTWRDGYRRDVATLAAHQKSRRGAPPYSLLVNRPLGRRLAAVAHGLGMSPNAVSLLSASLSALGLVLLAFVEPSVVTSTLVVLLLLVAYAVDSADGQLARLVSGGTLAGEWLDHSLDMVKMASFHAAILVSAVRFDRSMGDWPAATAIAFGIVAVTLFFVMILTDQLRRQAGGTAPVRSGSPWFLVAVAPTDYGVQCLWLLVRPQSTVFFAGYLLLAVLNLGYLGIGAVSRFTELQRLDRERGAS
ncbi:MAG: CDP-alcohol phosphatidyltransferase family protein [Acidimicrobiales bacterium]